MADLDSKSSCLVKSTLYF